MFNKVLEIKPANKIKSSERRGLINSFENDDIELLRNFKVPEKVSKAVFNSISISKGTLYFNEENGDPVFYQNREQEIFPLLHGLWTSLPNVCLPTILTHDFVIERLINGANLMIRGCIGPFEENSGLFKGNIVAVANYKQPKVAIAIGECMMDLDKPESDIPTSGIAVQIWTVVGDKMTKLGRPMDDVLKTVKLEDEEQKEDEKDKEELDNELNEHVTDSNQEGVNEKIDQINEAIEIINLDKDNENTNDYIDDSYKMITDDIDEMFKRSVLYTLSQDDLQLPISSTNFMSEHILKNLPVVDADLVNMKKTSWKKTRKFLKAIEKDGLIKLKGKDDDLKVISVAPRSDTRVAEFVPYRIRKINKSNNTDVKSDSNISQLKIEAYLKPTNSCRMLFNKIDEIYDAVYTEKQIKEFIKKYIQENPEIVSQKNKQLIVPDSTLENLGFLKPVKRNELTDKILSTFSPYYAIFREEDANSNDILVRSRVKPIRGKIPNIDILIESVKVGKRVATRISGCEKFLVDIEKFSNQLKIKCSGSANITEGKTGFVINVQGKHDTIAIDILNKQWGIPSKFVNVTNKTKRKK